jgi:Domain of unknown function (DUF397)
VVTTAITYAATGATTSVQPGPSTARSNLLVSNQFVGADRGRLFRSNDTGDTLAPPMPSKNPDGPKLIFTPDEWDAFVSGAKDGELDLSWRSGAPTPPEQPRVRRGLDRLSVPPAKPVSPGTDTCAGTELSWTACRSQPRSRPGTQVFAPCRDDRTSGARGVRPLRVRGLLPASCPGRSRSSGQLLIHARPLVSVAVSGDCHSVSCSPLGSARSDQ